MQYAGCRNWPGNLQLFQDIAFGMLIELYNFV